ncbi:MAG: maltodextrin glucosidase, partial [[Ruminococcus] faecis]|nr:maltodextrin glucosidase [Mediterraneibacter faecis]
VLVAINAGDSEFTAGNGELQGTFTELLVNTDEAETVTLNGQLTMPAYSVQFLKAV